MACESRLDVNARDPLRQESVGDKLQQSQASGGVAHRHRLDRLQLVGPDKGVHRKTRRKKKLYINARRPEGKHESSRNE